MKKIGKVIHYYDNICVAVLELTSGLKTGDRVKFVRGEEVLFEQEISSMQIDHKNISVAKKGCELGVKVDEPVKEGVEIYKVD